MSQASSIEWTDATWNPVCGCHKISPGCKHCYAEVFAERWRGIAGHPYEHGFDPRTAPEQLDAPLHWRKQRRVFVNSMSDLFLDEWEPEYIAAVFGVMGACPHHTFQVLTKRAAGMRRWFKWIGQSTLDGEFNRCLFEASDRIADKSEDIIGPAGGPWPLPNVWLGVSVEDREYGVPRIDELRKTPATVRFLSIEPLLEDVGELDLRGISWVIAGAESGNGARRMNEDWVRSIRDQCTAAGVSFFYKQRLDGRRKVSLPMLDGRQWSDFPEVSR